MNVVFRRGDITTRPAGALVLAILEGTRTPGGAAAAVDRRTRGALRRLLATGDFKGRYLETAVLHPPGVRVRRVVLVGLGPAKSLTVARVRHASAEAVRRARALGARTVITVTHGAGAGGLDAVAAAQAAAEGAVLGHYRHTAYRRDPGPAPLDRVEILERDADAASPLAGAVARGVAIAEGQCLARDLANTPGQDLVPEHFAARAKEIAKSTGARCEVLGVPQMERLGMGALLAVGRGSVHPPRFIVLERGPAPKRGVAVPTVVVIGKGITFDTGGISLKPREGMHRMKYDMSGAAAVLGLFAALPALELPMRIVGLVASAENMPGGRAFKPGDVLRAMDGTTIEVTNTDAEGRLVLADALAYAKRFEPEAIVDLATLTGAIVIALGREAAGLFTRDDALAGDLAAAGEACGERLWRLPLWDGYGADLKSDTADFVNSTGKSDGASIVAAKFLEHFAPVQAWAHLDIAGAAWSDSERGEHPRGATGYGVRLLAEWLSRRGARPT
jgi:leucyl aminopeptidase